MQASIDGSEEVWSAILASILTHIAVFVPLLFLEGVSSVMFRQLSIVVVFSLAMSLFVAVTLVPVLCSRLLVLPPPRRSAQRHRRQMYGLSERMLEAMDDGYKRIAPSGPRPPAERHRIERARPSWRAAFIYPKLTTEFSTQTDEGQVQVNIELPRGTRIEVTAPVLDRIEQMVKELVPEATDMIVNAGAGGFGPGRAGRWRRQPRQHPAAAHAEGRAEAFERADRLRSAPAAVGHPGRDRARQRLGRQQPDEPLPLGRRRLRRPGGGGRLSLEIRGEDIAGIAARRAGHQGPARPGTGRRRRTARPRRRPSRAVGPRRPRQGGAVRRQRHHRRQHAFGPTCPARRRPPSVRTARSSRSSCGCARTSASSRPTSRTC